MKKKIIFGNWKLNKTNEEIKSFCNVFNNLLKKDKNTSKTNVVYGIAPTFLGINTFFLANKTAAIVLAQNASTKNFGPYTGEISFELLKNNHVNTVIIGHSEVKKNLFETNKIINKKILTLLENNMTVVFCIGETLKDFEKNQTIATLKKQINECLKNINKNDIKNLIISYEPIWAINTGKTATKEIIKKTIDNIKKILFCIFKKDSQKISILYGGSVNEKNAKEILNINNVDGVLVGNASLDPENFYKIITLA